MDSPWAPLIFDPINSLPLLSGSRMADCCPAVTANKRPTAIARRSGAEDPGGIEGSHCPESASSGKFVGYSRE